MHDVEKFSAILENAGGFTKLYRRVSDSTVVLSM